MSDIIERKNFNLDVNKLESGDLKNVLTQFIDAAKEYAIVKEQEKIKRINMDYQMKKYLVRLKIQRDLVENYLNETFAIRREVITKIFDRLDHAVIENDTEVIVTSLNSLEGIVKADPLKEIHKLGQVFENDDDILEI